MTGEYLKENCRLTSHDIAAYCQVSKSTVLQWIKRGKLKAFNLPSRQYRVDKADFRVFLEEWNMPVRVRLYIRFFLTSRRKLRVEFHRFTDDNPLPPGTYKSPEC